MKTKPKDIKQKKIHLYSKGLIHCSVCVPKEMTEEEIEQEVNLENPTGIDSKWKVSKDKTFASEENNPSECTEDKGRMHYLMVC